ncbi:guanine nucleotide-binding protein subunit beta-2-like [Ctenocephalides felis]|uniref:guanine nucleotide-binding protein subunit beta-2-like n=1 Tax=Ctenocephalides felis TaxID=7515 RepID=UPI000E6E4F8C|nr:guanine nucleotide-binding protein subunit beta-2-like [Ctenocephalides felis]
MAPKANEELKALQTELNELFEKIKAEQGKVADCTFEEKCGDVPALPKVKLSTKRLLKGHINKVNAVHFSDDSRNCVSASLDGKLIIWDTWTSNKIQIIPLRSSWVMSVAFAPSGKFVACGGMDNMCTIYDLENKDSSGIPKMVRELAGYEGFLSSCRFLDDKNIITGSGDAKICKWDLETGRKTGEYLGHTGGVACISLASTGCYVTGSADSTCRLWDLRQPKMANCFFGHSADVNGICFHPNEQAFVSASEDKSSILFDVRSDQQLTKISSTNPNAGFTSCAVSLSGRIALCGSIDKSIHMWDLLKGQTMGTLSGHENRVTSVSLSKNGMALASCSWDQNVRIWLTA